MLTVRGDGRRLCRAAAAAASVTIAVHVDGRIGGAGAHGSVALVARHRQLGVGHLLALGKEKRVKRARVSYTYINT